MKMSSIHWTVKMCSYYYRTIRSCLEFVCKCGIWNIPFGHQPQKSRNPNTVIIIHNPDYNDPAAQTVPGSIA